MHHTQTDIFKFWRDIEVFTLPDLPTDIKPFNFSTPLPWENAASAAKPGIRYTVYFGRTAKKEVIAAIEQLLGQESAYLPDWEEPITGDTYLAVLLLDHEGRPAKENSYLQAAYMHGLRCLALKKPLTEIAQQLLTAQEAFKQRYQMLQEADTEDGTEQKGSIVGKSHLLDEVDALNKLCVGGLKCSHAIYCVPEKVYPGYSPDLGFLNSFYLDDLNLLSNATIQSGKGLAQYVSSGIPDQQRKDVLADRAELIQCLDPIHLPAGRWPSNPAFGLYTAQQGAVNSCVAELNEAAGLRGINGPPGTGKTTLLLDMIANVIVSRAERLLQTDVHALFEKTYNRIERPSGFAGYYTTNATVFADSSIVVASNNNAAVENISKELPAQSKIDTTAFADATYFAACATRLLSEESWGILSAPLGNASNRRLFRENFWETKEEQLGFNDWLWKVYKNANDNQTETYVQKFNALTKELSALLNEFAVFKQEASYFHNQLSTYLPTQQEKKRIEIESGSLQTSLDYLAGQIVTVTKQREEVETKIERLQTTIRLHQQNKPRFFLFHKVFSTTLFKNWQEPINRYLAQLDAFTKSQTELTQTFEDYQAKTQQLESNLAQIQHEIEQLDSKLKAYEQLRTRLHQTYDIPYSHLVDDFFFHQETDEIHLATPYASPKINTLRSRIFIQSLKLHEYAILTNAKQFRNNISLFMDMLGGKAEVSPSLTQTLWDTFFFCVPVVSTTLASVSRLFKPLGKETIAWLLVDEAGQAMPQSAAGMIWRSKRSIIIGDPLQIEPVVTVPQKLIQVLNKQNGVDSFWSPLRSSVQSLADRSSIRGTYLFTGTDEQRWSGFPLRTHRRCNDPMFTIANAIAYDKQMVKAQDDVPFSCSLGPSAWVHVEGKIVENRQVIPEEITVLQQMIGQLHGYPGKIFVISPFKSVAQKCHAVFKTAQSTISCGTIHTFQGKEADIVFIVLGSDPNKSGSRLWASQKPNMLNVALTRARRRVYVIGNKTKWGNCEYFKVMARHLP